MTVDGFKEQNGRKGDGRAEGLHLIGVTICSGAAFFRDDHSVLLYSSLHEPLHALILPTGRTLVFSGGKLMEPMHSTCFQAHHLHTHSLHPRSSKSKPRITYITPWLPMKAHVRKDRG